MDNESRVKKGYHCAWQIHYHIVFPVKYRKALLDEEVVQIIRETAAGIEERYEVEIETMGMDKNHIHLLCGAHPKLSPDVSSRSLKASPPGRYLHESLQSKSTFGVESSGQMVTMWQLSEKEPIGKLLRDISRSKDYQNKTSNSYRSLVFNTL